MNSASTSRPRVLQFITHLALGGAERVAFNLIEGLRDRYDFGVFVANGVEDSDVGRSMQRELDQMHVTLHVGTRVPIKFGGMMLAGLWAGRAVRAFKPDLIHLHTEIPESAYASMVAMRPSLGRIPIVRTMHNTTYWNPWRKLGRWCDKRMGRSFVACVSKGAQEAFEELRAESGGGALPVPPRIVFNGVVVRDQPRPIGKLPGDRVRILFAGRFEPQKGADLLPQIIRGIRPREGQSCELTIHGSGTHEPQLRAMAADPPAGWSISINGPVPNLSSRMPGFDLMIMPSRYEGLALSAIEAALLGVPLVATDGPGVIEGFPTGYPWLARAGDAADFARHVQQALDDPASWAAAAESAQAFARQHFDLAVMCGAYAALYQQAMG